MNDLFDLIQDIRNGKMVVLVDDENRENEGDLIIAADHITPQAINFMAAEARGLICLALTQSRIQSLGIPMMVNEASNNSPNKTAFTVSIEASLGISTGISAADRAHTVRVAASPQSGPDDVIMPGHIFPIQAEAGGVLKRAGHTEAGVDLASLAGLNPAAVICEVMNSDGTMARVPQLRAFAKKHGLKMGSIEDLIAYRVEHESFVEQRVCANLPSNLLKGFKVFVFKNSIDGCEHMALVKGEIKRNGPALVRMHRENLMGDVFHSQAHGGREPLQRAIELIHQEGSGVLVYLRHKSTSSRLEEEVRRCGGQSFLESCGAAGVNDKDYGVGAQILRALGVQELKLITNSPVKKIGIKGYGLKIVETVSLSQEAGWREPVELF